MFFPGRLSYEGSTGRLVLGILGPVALGGGTLDRFRNLNAISCLLPIFYKVTTTASTANYWPLLQAFRGLLHCSANSIPPLNRSEYLLTPLLTPSPLQSLFPSKIFKTGTKRTCSTYVHGSRELIVQFAACTRAHGRENVQAVSFHSPTTHRIRSLTCGVHV